MLGPIVISTLFVDKGPQVAWLAEILVIGITLLLWFACLGRMVPLEELPPDAVLRPPSGRRLMEWARRRATRYNGGDDPRIEEPLLPTSRGGRRRFDPAGAEEVGYSTTAPTSREGHTS